LRAFAKDVTRMAKAKEKKKGTNAKTVQTRRRQNGDVRKKNKSGQ